MRARNIELLGKLGEPSLLWQYFLMLCEIPHPSGHCGPAAEAIAKIGRDLGHDVAFDKKGNAHIDMVPVSSEGYNFDFEKTPLDVYIDGDYMKADRTTLGVAFCLAVAADKTLKHGPLECLFTLDEETDMSGAEQLEGAPFLLSKHFINVDNEDEGKICIGNAGGFETEVTLPCKMEIGPHVTLTFSGLLGGHTGCDIHKDNVVELLKTKLLHRFQLLVAEYQPIEGVYLAASKTFKHDMKLDIVCNRADAAVAPATFTDTLCNMLLSLPDGVIRMIPSVPGTVETSIALVRCNLIGDQCVIMMHARSSSAYQLDVLDTKLHSIVAMTPAAGIVSPINPYPSWKANPYSDIVSILQKAAVRVSSAKYEEFAVHAGLECGYILSHYPDMDCASVGPNIHDPHTPMERVSIGSCSRFYTFMRAALTIMCE